MILAAIPEVIKGTYNSEENSEEMCMESCIEMEINSVG